jgi:hypothetical protein
MPPPLETGNRRQETEVLTLPLQPPAQREDHAPDILPLKAREETFFGAAHPGHADWPARLAHFARAFRQRLAPALLLLIQDVGMLTGVVARKQGAVWHFSAPVHSGVADFGHALDIVLARLRQQGDNPPRRCFLAARAIVPARVDLPVSPEKPRPLLQMREMARAEMEPAVAEFGALWNLGGVLAAQGLITPEARERIALELAVRREGTNNKPTYYGQVACELGFISPEDLENALRAQEKLQMLETWLACGWRGHAGEPGEPPVWLASATGLSLWSQFERALKGHSLKLLGALPLAWSASETAGEMESGESRIALEIHTEEIVAVLRHQGRVAAARSEGRMERPLSAERLLHLVSDWRASGIHDLEIVCVDPADEAALTALLEEIGHHWGHMPRFRNAAATRQAVLAALAGQYRNTRGVLPLIQFGELPKPPWKKTGFWHVAAPLLTLAVVCAIAFQQYRDIRSIQQRFAEKESESQKSAELRQEEARIFQEAQQAQRDLAETRKKLIQTAPEVERLESIEKMTSLLPQLLRTLAANVGDSVVLESVRNNGGIHDTGNVRIVGWSNDYTSAQDFAQRTQEALAGMGYAVAQTDVQGAPGRDKQPGYFVSFWLIPIAGPDELGAAEASSEGQDR